MKKIISGLIASILIIGTFTGCASKNNKVEQPTMSENLKQSSNTIAKNQQSLEQKQPAPKIDYSNERANLIKRAVTFNAPNKVSYIYLFTKSGTVAGFYTVKGKVSSISSYLVPDEQIVKDPYYDYSSGQGATTSVGVVVQAPDIDGSYGTNGGGIFFYTTDDTYVEWNGEYMLCDKPLKMATQPVLTREIK